MKKLFIILIVLILVGCSGGKQKLLDEIKEKEKIVMKSYEDVADKKTSESLRQDYLEFADEYPDDSLSPKFLHKAAELALAIDMPNEALNHIDTLVKLYPDYLYLPDAIFFKGFIQESYLKDLSAARKTYEDFMKRYPNHELATQVSFSLENLGKSPEDLVEEFMNRTQQADSLVSDTISAK